MSLIQKPYNYIKSHRLILNLIIIFSFVVFSIFSVLLIWNSNKLHFLGDAAFHTARLYDVIKSKAIFPRYAMDSFSFIGTSVMTMYPYIFLYITAIIFYIVKSIKLSIFIAFIFWTFTTFLISFYSSLYLNHNKKISYIFSLIYGLSGEFTSMYFLSPDVGVYFSSIFLPLVIFGFIYYIRYNKWIMLSIGMSLILFSSTISFILVSFLLLAWLIFNYKILNKFKLLYLSKAILLTIITTALVWIPILKMMLFNHMSVPTNTTIGSVNVEDLIMDSLNNNFVPNNMNQMLTIYSLVGVLIGGIFFKKLPHLVKQMYLFSVFVILFSSSLFPWQIFNGDSALLKLIRSIQFTVRLLVVPQVILEFILSFCVIKYLTVHVKYTRKLVICLFTLLILFIQMSSQELYITSNQGTVNNFNQTKQAVINVQYKDYWPMKSISKKDDLFNHVGKSSNHKSISFIPHGDGDFTFRTNKHDHGKLVIPFLDYYGTNYRCVLDHRLISSKPDSHQMMEINHVASGHHNIHISIPLSGLTIFSRIISSCSIIIYIIIAFVKLKKHNVMRKIKAIL